MAAPLVDARRERSRDHLGGGISVGDRAGLVLGTAREVGITGLVKGVGANTGCTNQPPGCIPTPDADRAVPGGVKVRRLALETGSSKRVDLTPPEHPSPSPYRKRNVPLVQASRQIRQQVLGHGHRGRNTHFFNRSFITQLVSFEHVRYHGLTGDSVKTL
ncbi:hypothetical protein H2248_008131 [Termitomyces sp. 'cryptogamus']|nr:hypothetical protein H2248_008131 [Termitomyces sp. 'cryptogamus']